MNRSQLLVYKNFIIVTNQARQTQKATLLFHTTKCMHTKFLTKHLQTLYKLETMKDTYNIHLRQLQTEHCG